MSSIITSQRGNPPNEDWALSNAYWIAQLSDLTTFYGDGHDPTPIGEDSAWTELKNHLHDNSIRLTNLIMKFRSHEVHFPVSPDIDWIYFSKGMGREWTADNPDRFFIFGRQSTESMMELEWYKTPELLIHKTTARELSRLKEEFLCQNPR